MNELDWELDKAGLQFVRYADDSIVMCKTPEELEKAKEVVHRVLAELGLELAEDKTDEIDFHQKDFNYLGFTFQHLRVSKKGRTYYVVGPSEKSIKKFKEDVKKLTGKTVSKSFEQWTSLLNPILRGKYNYFLIASRACKAVKEALAEREVPFHGLSYDGYVKLDGYVRQRLRVNFANRGKRHAKVWDAKLYTVKFGVAFFIKVMGLVCGEFMNWQTWTPEVSVEEFLSRRYRPKWQGTAKADRFFALAYAKK